MKSFLRNTFLYLIVICLLFVVLDYVISVNLKNSHWRKYDTWTKIVSSEFVDNDMIILGSSRAWKQYSPQIIDSLCNVNSYNMGIDGSSCDRQMMRWYLYKRFNNHKPKYILQNIDYLTSLGCTNGYEREQFFPYFWNQTFREVLFRFEKFSFAEKYIPMYRYFSFGLANIYDAEMAPIKTKGYYGANLKWNGDGLRKTGKRKFAIENWIENEFKNYIKSIKDDNIQIVLVLAPMYIGIKEKCIELDKMYDTYKAIATKYNVPLLDYTFCEISQDSTLFYNATHLNKQGSELFSLKLGQDLNTIFYKNEQ